MFKNLNVIVMFFLFSVFSSTARANNFELENSSLEIQTKPAIYIETIQQGGTVKEEKLVLTDENKKLLIDSLEEIVALFEETTKTLKNKNSVFEIKEVEIYGSLKGEASAWVLKGAAEASFKIILHPVRQQKIKGHYN